MSLEEKIKELMGNNMDKVNRFEVLDLIKEAKEGMTARSGWEMLPCCNFPKLYQQFYDKGVKDMEQVWHDIIREELGKFERVKK